MLLGMSSAMFACFPTLLLIGTIIVLFSTGCKDIFRNHVYDPNTNEEAYTTMQLSLQSAFAMFVGEWSDYMYASIDATTEAAYMYFAPSAFLISILCVEVVVGVIILHYSKIASVPYTGRLYGALEPIFNYQEQECEALTTVALRIHRALQPHEEAIAFLVGTLSKDGPTPMDSIRVRHVTEQHALVQQFKALQQRQNDELSRVAVESEARNLRERNRREELESELARLGDGGVETDRAPSA